MAKAKKSAMVFQLKITLKNIKPPVWRRVQVMDCSLAVLDDIIQNCMGWEHSHMHSFEIGGEEYGEPDPSGMVEMNDERKMKLSRVVNEGCEKMTYIYDFGDNWEHMIQVEKLFEAEPGVHYPRCIAGKRACPPEDCGGAWGYGDLLKAIGNPKHKEHQEMLEWIGGAFDPEQFDIDAVNQELA